MKIGFISLGCSKNLVDSEKMMGMINSGGHELVHNADEAEAIIINTCGFINSAKEEAIQTIFQMAEYKKHRCRKLIVVGCLAQRYKEQLEQDIPEIDAVISIREYPHLHELLPKLLDGHDLVSYDKCERKVSSKPWTAYLKIAEGCSNHCTYCAIPLIRGDNVSFPIEQLVEEAKQLAQRGVMELVVIAQDTTKYGVDLYGRRALLDLLQQLHEIEGFHWIRILYMYPDEIDARLIEGMAKLPKVLPYFDIPMQHASNRMLQLMNRRGSREEVAGNLFLSNPAYNLYCRIPDRGGRRFQRAYAVCRGYPLGPYGSLSLFPGGGHPCLFYGWGRGRGCKGSASGAADEASGGNITGESETYGRRDH